MIIKITPDKEKAKSLINMAEASLKNIKLLISALGLKENQTLIAKEYYEAIKQLIEAIMSSEGLKAIGENAHKENINYLKNFGEFFEQEVLLLQDLRIRRNKSMYEGKFINKPYLENNGEKLEKITLKLKKISLKKIH